MPLTASITVNEWKKIGEMPFGGIQGGITLNDPLVVPVICLLFLGRVVYLGKWLRKGKIPEDMEEILLIQFISL